MSQQQWRQGASRVRFGRPEPARNAAEGVLLTMTVVCLTLQVVAWTTLVALLR
jgi:hypothetical protein